MLPVVSNLPGKVVPEGLISIWKIKIIPNKHIRDSAVDKSGYNLQVVYTRALSLRFANADRSKRLIDLYDSRMPVLLENGSIQRLFKKWGFPCTSFDPSPTETAGDP
jgi:hypothetical protein